MFYQLHHVLPSWSESGYLLFSSDFDVPAHESEDSDATSSLLIRRKESGYLLFSSDACPDISHSRSAGAPCVVSYSRPAPRLDVPANESKEAHISLDICRCPNPLMQTVCRAKTR